MGKIKILQNQAINFHYLNPTEEQVLNGFPSWQNGAYNNRSNCYGGNDFCQIYEKNDMLNFQFEVATYDENLNITVPTTGTCTAPALLKLKSTLPQFNATSSPVGAYVYNTTTNQCTRILAIDSTTQLSIEANIFPTSGEGFNIISNYIGGTGAILNAVNLDVAINYPTPSFFKIINLFEQNKWYKITGKIKSYESGTLSVFVGTSLITDLVENGEFTIFAKYTNPTISPVNALNFVSSTSTNMVLEGGINIEEVVTEYELTVLDDTLTQTTSQIFQVDYLNMGIGTYSEQFVNLISDCGEYYIEVTPNYNCSLDSNLVTNGNFSSTSNWTLTGTVDISAGKLNFNNEEYTVGSATQTLDCDCIVGSQEYNLQFTVAPLGGVIDGEVMVVVNGVEIEQFGEGVNNVQFIPANDVSCTLQFLGVGENNRYTIDNVVLTVNSTTPTEIRSECLCVCDEHECSYLILYKSTRNIFGFNYNSDGVDFTQYLRIEKSNTENNHLEDLEFEPFKSNLETMQTVYANLQNTFELHTGHIPDYLHNILMVALSHDILAVDGVLVARTGEYSFSHDRDSRMAMAKVELSKVNQKSLRAII